MIVEADLRTSFIDRGSASIAAVSDSVWEALTAAGLDTRRCADRREPIARVDWLDARALASAFRDDLALGLRRLTLAFSVDSTNTRALAATPVAPGACDLWLADHQQAGRGRRGARWISPFASGLCMTLATAVVRRDDLSTLSLVAGMAVCEALHELGAADARVKWPNDIVVQGRKLGGLLVQTRHSAGQPVTCAIGIGLNVQVAPTQLAANAVASTCLATLPAMRTSSRHDVAVAVLRRVAASVQCFSNEGFAPFVRRWPGVDALAGQPIDVIDAQDEGADVRGVAGGIDAAGRLCVDTASGRRRVTSGAVHVRSASLHAAGVRRG